MLVRISGANDGITQYLIDGVKNGRDFTRDELDKRVILDGDLDLTDQVISSIPNRGQERYLHITLSFHEERVDEDILKKVTEDYKKLLMSSHEFDEYNFYAEAHIPKIKQITDYRTGEEVERKPHIHIVIPNKNLLTGKSLNAVGLVERNIKELDAIQEHINLKYGFESPKDHLRIQGGDRSEIISREKADIFKESRGELKAKIFEDMEKNNIRDDIDFRNMLEKYGEVKIYKEGKPDRYFAVKPAGDKRFTRLKSRAFNKEYIEKRSLAEPIKNVTQINKLVENWRNVTSKEIKYINPRTKSKRVQYALLSKQAKVEYIKNEENEYYGKHKDSIGYLHRKGSDLKSGVKELKRETRAITASSSQRLPSMRERQLVHTIRGRGTGEFNPLLPSYDGNNVAEKRQARLDTGREVRHKAYRDIDNLKPKTSAIKNDPFIIDKEELKTLDYIKKNIDPERFLSHCIVNYLMDPSKHKIGRGKDGSHRFSDNKRNWNALDFLTRTVNLDLDEAVEELKNIYNSQVRDDSYIKVESKINLTREDLKEKREAIHYQSSKIRSLYKNEVKLSNKEFSEKINDLYENLKGSYKERETLKTFYLAMKMNRYSVLKKKFESSLKEIRAIHYNYDPSKKKEYEMKFRKLAQKFKDDGNVIEAHSPYLSFEEVMEKNKRDLDLEDNINKKKVASIADFAVVKNEKKGTVAFVDPATRETVFQDNGNHIKYNGTEDKDATLAALEYAHAKFGGKIKLTGSADFKKACVEALAESDMVVILAPKELHAEMMKLKSEMELKKNPPKEVKITAFDAQIEKIKELDREYRDADPESKINALEAKNEYAAKVVASLVIESEKTTGEPTTKELVNDKTLLVKDALEKDFKEANNNWLTGKGVTPPNQDNFSIMDNSSIIDIEERASNIVDKEQEKDLDLTSNHRSKITERVALELQEKGIERTEMDLNSMANDAIIQYSKYIKNNKVFADKAKNQVNVNGKNIKTPENIFTKKGMISIAAYDYVLDNVNERIDREQAADLTINKENDNNRNHVQDRSFDQAMDDYRDPRDDWDLDR